jgi:hypothetical protein
MNMKIVRETLNEIKQDMEGSGLRALGMGGVAVIKKWADKKVEKNDLSWSYSIDNDFLIHAIDITIRKNELKKMPFPPEIKSLKHIYYIQCVDCMFDKEGKIVPRDRSDFIKGIKYFIEKDGTYTILTYDFVAHYLYYTALKFIASFGDKGVHDSEVLNKIKIMAMPNTDPEKNGYWDAVFQARYHTPISECTDRIAPRTYRINRDGLNYIEDHEYLFEK